MGDFFPWSGLTLADGTRVACPGITGDDTLLKAVLKAVPETARNAPRSWRGGGSRRRRWRRWSGGVCERGSGQSAGLLSRMLRRHRLTVQHTEQEQRLPSTPLFDLFARRP